MLCDSNLLIEKKYSKLSYFHCKSCDLIFLNPEQRLDHQQEKQRYLKHENNVLDLGYQKFAAGLHKIILENVTVASVGLDYGSGKDSAISYMLSQSGYAIRKFDPYFLNDSEALGENFYDYIVVCEVAEHFYKPKAEFFKLKSYLKNNGSLFVMTSLVTDQINFETWSYRRDSTHVCFYSKNTCDFIKDFFGFKHMRIEQNQLIVFFN